MKTEKLFEVFELIYSTDLVYVPDCWKLCGDAHCCSFSRYKSKFQMIATSPSQELPLLPGEFEFLSSKGWLAQFGDFEHRVVEYPIEKGNLRVETIVSRRPNCACDHDTRTTICRLYPLFPVFNIEGRLIGSEATGIYDELERIEGLSPACKLESLPFDQTEAFFSITAALGKTPIHLFYLEAYRIAKNHVADRISNQCSEGGSDAFSLYEYGAVRRSLIDHNYLRDRLNETAQRFADRFGKQFSLS